MSSPDSSRSSELFQIAMSLGRMEQRQEHQARSLDTLIRILQEERSSQPASPEPQPLRRSMLGGVLEKIAGKVSTEVVIRLGLLVIQYLVPASVIAFGIIKSLLRMVGIL